jgi:hypothetical protein
LDNLKKAEIEHDCHWLSVAYARYVDFHQYDDFADLFDIEGLLDTGVPLMGREVIRKAMTRRTDKLRSRHVLTNIHINVIDETHATGLTYLTLYRHIGEESLEFSKPIAFQGPAAIGHYDDEFIHTTRGWRFASRKLEFAFRNAAAFPHEAR